MGLGIIGGCSLFLPNAWAWVYITFSAFFLLVFAIAVRYRPATAYSAGFLAAASYSLLLWHHYESFALFAILINFIEPFVLFTASSIMEQPVRVS